MPGTKGQRRRRNQHHLVSRQNLHRKIFSSRPDEATCTVSPTNAAGNAATLLPRTWRQGRQQSDGNV
eukprot:scaffold282500_cov17-Prasinocladus_malaysianus.AAC.1